MVYRDTVTVRHDTVYRTRVTLRTLRTTDTLWRTLLRADTLVQRDTVRDTVRLQASEATRDRDKGDHATRWALILLAAALAILAINQVKQHKN